LARRIERAATREQVLAVYDEFRMTPAATMLSPDGVIVLMQLIGKKLRGKRTR
jgi:hypothetical protein